MKLGVGPGSVLTWDEQGDCVTVQRAGQFSSIEIHAALFPAGTPKSRPVPDVKAAVRKYIQQRHAHG
jgi:hypothetical protein